MSAPAAGAALLPRASVPEQRAVGAAQRFRTDVEGLRAIAVLAVVAFHASVPGLQGGFVGVDVFFVISGYLISGLLLREVQSTGRIDFRGFFARRARRILPVATVVLLVTMGASYALEPLLGVYNTARSILAAGFYLANWHFIDLDTDYFAMGAAESPVLHYWSLAVEEQFYLVWPFVVLGAFLLARRAPLASAKIITLCLAAVTIASLAAALVLTETDPALAYMATTTRAWEFGLGAIIASMGHWFEARRASPATPRVGWLLGWLGMAGIAYSVVFFDESVPFPGSAALVPTLGTAAIIVGGILAAHGSTTVGALLSLQPVRYVGRLSFGWYLWHWPVLILAQAVAGPLSWEWQVLLVLGALALAAVTLQAIEIPFTRWKQVARNASGAIALGLLCVVLVTAAGLSVGSVAVATLSSNDSAMEIDSATFTEVFGPDTGTNSGPVTPNPIDAPADAPVPEDCLLDKEVGETLSCTAGEAGGTPVALFGDSHAHQWLSAIDKIGIDQGWEISVFARAGCPVPDLEPRNDGGRFSEPECPQWRQGSIDAIVDEVRPRLIIVSSLHTYVPSTAEMLEAWDVSLTQLREAGAPIVYLRDTAHPEEDIPTCVSSAFDDWTRCAFEHDGIEEPVIRQAIIGNQPGVSVVDMLPYFCDRGTCPAVRNGLLLYRDSSHITSTAALALAPAIVEALERNDVMP